MALSEPTYRIDPATGLREVTIGTRPESDRVMRVIQKQVCEIAYDLTERAVRGSTFMMLERVWGMQTRPPDFWEMWVGASEYAMKGIVGSVGDVFGYAYREVDHSACTAVVRLEFYGVFPYVALIYRPDFAVKGARPSETRALPARYALTSSREPAAPSTASARHRRRSRDCSSRASPYARSRRCRRSAGRPKYS
jgi:hypothetical protein